LIISSADNHKIRSFFNSIFQFTFWLNQIVWVNFETRSRIIYGLNSTNQALPKIQQAE